MIDLRRNTKGDFTPGRPLSSRVLWHGVETLLFRNPLVTSYRLKRWVLRSFGAKIGRGVLIKPGVRVKFPWRLRVGDYTWIGEGAWIDNLAPVDIGSHACVSQGAYLCTGNHDWSDVGMRLVTKPISIGDGAWVGAFSLVGPGVRIGKQAVITLGSVLVTDAEPGVIYSGNPAVARRRRQVRGTGSYGEVQE